jgi:hypothetical protein
MMGKYQKSLNILQGLKKDTPMDQHILARFHEGILQEAMQRHGISREGIQAIDTFENFIYEFERGDANYIMRISHSLRKSELTAK